VLPEGDEGGGSILAVVHQDDHSIGVHGFAHVEVVVLEAADDLLGETLSALLEGRDVLRGSVLLGHLRLDSLHVAYKL